MLWDLTNQFLLIPDLGADLVRIYGMDESARLFEMTALNVPPGTGPRHATWWSPTPSEATNGGPLFLLVDGELSGLVLMYRATYTEKTKALMFTLVSQTNALGRDISPKQSLPAEITVSVRIGISCKIRD